MMEGWKKYQIGDLVLKSKLRDPKKESEKYFKYVDVSSVSRESYTITGYTITKGAEAPSRARKIIQTDDVIFATVRPTLMRISLVPTGLNNEICSTGYCVLKPNKELINPAFLYYSILTEYFISKIEKLQRGANYPAIRDSDLRDQFINVPFLPEQRKISYVLGMVQKAIEKQDRLIKITTELKKALMQKLFTEGLYGEQQKETEIGLVPENWEVVELINVCEKPQYGFTDSAAKSGNANFLRITDITEHGVNWSNVPYCQCPDLEKYELKNGDIVFARIGATTGKSYLIENPPLSIYASYLIRVRCKAEIIPQFLIYYFETEQYWCQINARKGDNLKGGVNGSVLSKLFIPKPDIEEQNEIACTFKMLDKKVAFALSKKRTLTALFKTLLHDLMTGQSRVHKLEFEGMIKKYEIEKQPLSIAAEK